MPALTEGWRIQVRVLSALMIREIHTHYGRENIGFLWIAVEPLLFASLVSILWTAMGHSEHGMNVTAFVVSGYIPIMLYRHAVSRSIWVFRANGGLLYHRQILILDFVLVRFLIELVGSLVAYILAFTVLRVFDVFPPMHDMGLFLLGYAYFALFTLATCLIIAPLSEMSEVIEKFVPVTLYILVPLSGCFYMVSWFSPATQSVLLYAPMVSMYEMMRSGIFGHAVEAHYLFIYPMAWTIACIALGLYLCRHVRSILVVE